MIASSPVSVVVVTYNSAHFVCETLDSIAAQSHARLELIISDDASKDNTVDVCRDWLQKNSNRFTAVNLLQAAENAGISANCLTGLNASSGKWVKFLGGDDLLLPDCISSFVAFAEGTNSSCVISKMKEMSGDTVKDYTLQQEKFKAFMKLSCRKKYYTYLCDPFFLNAPASFFCKNMLDDIKPFYIDYKLLEDQPLFLSILRNGFDISYLPEPTVIYRRHTKSTTGSFNKSLYTTLSHCYGEFRKPFIRNTVSGRLLKFFWGLYYSVIINNYENPSVIHRFKANLYRYCIHICTRLENF